MIHVDNQPSDPLRQNRRWPSVTTQIFIGLLLGIGLGSHIRHAHKLHCAESYDLEKAAVTPVGPACAICPRVDCGYRATPPAGRTLAIDRTKKTISPFPFVAN